MYEHCVTSKLQRKMKKVSAKVFFTMMWRGVCQAAAFLLRPFGYKREGRFAKCVWGLFATSAAVIMTIIAADEVWSFGEKVYNDYFREAHCYDSNCIYAECVGEGVYFHHNENGAGYIFNSETREKTLEDVIWISEPEYSDSLVCFSTGKKRGFFSKYTGKVVIEPKYDHAWLFSEGLACVDVGGWIKFIDPEGKVVIDTQMPYRPGMDGYMFHGGYCVVGTDDGEHDGLMDKTGSFVLPQEYSCIVQDDDELWHLTKGEEMGVVDKDMKIVIPLTECCSMYIGEETIDMVMPDHTIRKYDLQGNLINDFYITDVRTLEYEKDEILCQIRTYDDDGEEYAESFVASYHPKATARLRAYVAGEGYEGLMTADGHVVIMPLYQGIKALGHDLYLCTSTNYDKVIVNGKGEIVR